MPKTHSTDGWHQGSGAPARGSAGGGGPLLTTEPHPAGGRPGKSQSACGGRLGPPPGMTGLLLIWCQNRLIVKEVMREKTRTLFQFPETVAETVASTSPLTRQGPGRLSRCLCRALPATWGGWLQPWARRTRCSECGEGPGCRGLPRPAGRPGDTSAIKGCLLSEAPAEQRPLC